MGKYAPEALQAVRDAGYASRVEALQGAVESVGGRLESLDFMPSAYEFDVMIRADLPSPAAHFALTGMVMASGIAVSATTYELFTAEEADLAVGDAGNQYTRPDR